jgi:hypothetical protein
MVTSKNGHFLRTMTGKVTPCILWPNSLGRSVGTRNKLCVYVSKVERHYDGPGGR